MFELTILVCGFPGKSSTHGGLGWSTIALLSEDGRHTIVDGGSFGVRRLLLRKLREQGLEASDISTVLLTHSHYDHSVNWTLFPNAEIVIGRADMEWALQELPDGWMVPELYIQELSRSPRIRLIEHGDEVMQGIVAYQVSGHTPGHLAYVVDNGDTDIVFSADAAKSRAELVSRDVTLTLDEESSRQSIAFLWDLWRRKPNTIMVPGHDVPMVLKEGEPTYIGEGLTSIEAWFGDDLKHVSEFKLR